MDTNSKCEKAMPCKKEYQGKYQKTRKGKTDMETAAN